MTQSKTFLQNFSNAMAPAQEPTTTTQAIAPTPLSNKTGINTKKSTALQQGILQGLSQPMMAGAQEV